VGFIQAPQDYRDWQDASYYRRLYYSYKYFFAVSQPSRNEHDGAIFAGTMGLIRRKALEDAGGWDEWCITEDAELSLRLLRAGWSGLHVDASFGHGVMPLTFEALKSQRYRWCFGGIQILRMHVRSLLPGRGDAANRMTLAQRWAYLCGALQWYGDLLGLAFFAFLLAGAVNLVTGGDQLFRKLTAFLVATVPVLVALGLVRAVALLRRGTGASWRDALGAFFVWQSTSLVVARASVQALFARKAAFLRTPRRCSPSWACWRWSAGSPGSTRSADRCWPGCCCSRRWGSRPHRSTAWPRSAPRCRRTCGPAGAASGCATGPCGAGRRPAVPSPCWRGWPPSWPCWSRRARTS